MPNNSDRKDSDKPTRKSKPPEFPPRLPNVDDDEMRLVTQHFVSIMQNKTFSCETQMALSKFIQSMAKDVNYYNPQMIEALYPILYCGACANQLSPRAPVGPPRFPKDL